MPARPAPGSIAARAPPSKEARAARGLALRPGSYPNRIAADRQRGV